MPRVTRRRPRPRPCAMRASHLRLWIVVVSGLALDLWSKQWAFHTLRQGGHRTLIPNVLEFHTTLNPGALFGIGAGRTAYSCSPPSSRSCSSSGCSPSARPAVGSRTLRSAAILAGALGNMYDRAFVDLVEYVTPTPGGRAIRYYVESPARTAGRSCCTSTRPRTISRRCKCRSPLAQLCRAGGLRAGFHQDSDALVRRARALAVGVQRRGHVAGRRRGDSGVAAAARPQGPRRDEPRKGPWH